jgi:hypothetical protein
MMLAVELLKQYEPIEQEKEDDRNEERPITE